MRNNIKVNAKAYVVCLLAAMFYLYEFVLQVSPSVMTSELMKAFMIGAGGLGLMSSFYYYAYTPMQLPAGLLYDRFGPRRVLTAAILVCTTGAFFFSTTNNIQMASLGRAFMGAGSAFSFIGALLLVSRWFPAKYFAFLAGIVQLMSCVGAICGQIPIAAAVNSFGWRQTLSAVAIAGLVLAAAVWIFVRDYPANATVLTTKNLTPKTNEWQRLHRVLSKSQSWLIGLYSFANWGPIVVFAALWGIPYLVARYDVSTTLASTACSMIWVGLGIGCPLMGWWSDHIKRRRTPLIFCSLIAIFVALSILYIPTISFHQMYLLLFLFGFAASGQSLAFALVKDINTPEVTGTAIGFNNMLVVAGGAIFQPLAGFILHLHWNGQYLNGIRFYSAQNYISAMIILPICGIVALAISYFGLRETFCEASWEASKVN